MPGFFLLLALEFFCFAAAGAGPTVAGTPASPLGLPPVPWPKDNPYNQSKAELGKLLFFDGRLSSNGIVSCAFCHDPNHSFSADTPFSTGVDGQPTGRHTPTLINRAWGKDEFWDGRSPTLEAQPVIPITNPHEMGMSADGVVAKLQMIGGYAPLFRGVFGHAAINLTRVSQAIAIFERVLNSGNSPYDRYVAGDKNALTKSQKAGLQFFNAKGECAECHSGPNFTDEKFANIGVGMAAEHPDLGRADVTKKKSDIGKFKVPSLRDLARRGPYMHDGSLRTLGDVLNFYAKGGLPNRHIDTRLVPFYMDAKIKNNLLDFLQSLNGQDIARIDSPKQFPQ